MLCLPGFDAGRERGPRRRRFRRVRRVEVVEPALIDQLLEVGQLARGHPLPAPGRGPFRRSRGRRASARTSAAAARCGTRTAGETGNGKRHETGNWTTHVTISEKGLARAGATRWRSAEYSTRSTAHRAPAAAPKVPVNLRRGALVSCSVGAPRRPRLEEPRMRTLTLTRLGLSAALAIAVAFPVAAADQTFERSLTVSGAVTLSVSTGSGDITVRTGSDGVVKVVGTVRPASTWGVGSQDAESAVRAVLSSPPVLQNGNTIEIGKIADQEVARRVSISYDVTVPKSTTLSANSGSGDIAVSDLAGGVSARAGSGDVRVGRIDGPVSAKVGSGDVVDRRYAWAGRGQHRQRRRQRRGRGRCGECEDGQRRRASTPVGARGARRVERVRRHRRARRGGAAARAFGQR